MSRTIKGTDRREIKRARRADRMTRKARQAISRANGR